MKKLVIDLPEINDYRMVEGLNQLKTNLAFCGKDIKVITMTSSVPNEGKSSVSLSLSRTLAESGKKILMVDADLRKSVMAARYHIQGIDKGLSHYLTGQAEVEDIIYETEVEGLCITVAGPLSPDPTSILDSEQFEQFIENVRDMFDYVIIDAPPLGVVIDAVIIGKYTDGAVIVIEQGMIKRKIVQDVIKQLKRGEVRILGAVLNKVDERIGAYGNYEYKYSYYGESDTGKITQILNKEECKYEYKIIKKAAACGLSAVMAFGLVAVTEAPKTANVSAATKKVKKLSFKKKGYVISASGHWMNAKTRLKFSPKSAKTYKLKYKTSNKKIATISKNGIIRAKKKGTVTITAIAKNNKKAKATTKVTVGKVVKTLKFKEGKKKTVTAGKKFTLHPTYSPKKASTKAVTFKSSNKKVATVTSKGKVTAKKAGKVTITATCKDAKR